MHRHALLAAAALSLGLAPAAQASPLHDLDLTRTPEGIELRLDGGEPFRTTQNEVRNARLLEFPGATTTVALWEEFLPLSGPTPFYAISLDGRTMATVEQTSYLIRMRRESFDPKIGQPRFPGSLLGGGGEMYFVQYVTQPLDVYRAALEDLGAVVQGSVSGHAAMVRMSASVRDEVGQLPFVRWVGPLHSEFRLDPDLIDLLGSGELADARRYNLLVFDKRTGQQFQVADKIEALGGQVDVVGEGTFHMEVTLDEYQLIDVAGMDEVMWIDLWGPMEADMDIVRQIGGANYIEGLAGFNGTGVRGEVADTGVINHGDFNPNPIIHGSNSSSTSHGTAVFGIVFGDGGGNAAARGLLPNGTGYFAATSGWTSSSGSPGTGPGTRYFHTGQLVSAPWNCVFQTNSTGSPRTFFYTSVSAQMDEAVFDHDIIICQSQSNAGNQDSRPQAWGKNMVAVGGVRHQNTLSTADDTWSFGGSIGPANDGRLKPDLAHFYDNVLTTSSSGGYTQFSGTSSATPIVAGHFGLFFEMWHAGIFGNTPGTSVFDSKPHFTTAKAMLINTASQWNFVGANHDLTRTHQGWGRPDLMTMYDGANDMLIVDETDVLANLGSTSYNVDVSTGTPALKATMVYADPPGTPGTTPHRINDLTLKVTSPGGTVYWGNNGLAANMWSTSGGIANTVDTVENVFVQSPAAGTWVVEVIASVVTQDSHPETPQLDADYALVVSGVDAPPICPSPTTYCTAKFTTQVTLPKIGATGTGSLANNNLVITLSDAVPNRNGIVFWGSQPNSANFFGGVLCVKQPIKRTPLTSTDGSGFASYAQNIDPLMVGTDRYYQWWFRDPPDFWHVGLSDGLKVTFCP